jgi:iron complex transport system permease protein
VSRASLRRTGPLLTLLGVLLALSLLVNLALGAVSISLPELGRILCSALGVSTAVDPLERAVILEIRLPRLLMAAVVGAALGVSGALLQGLFKNPLADPGLIGVSSGAVLGAATSIVLGSAIGWSPQSSIWALPLSAFAGAVLVTLVVWRLARRGGRTDVRTLLLAGIAINALVGAAIGLLVLAASETQLGSLGGVSYPELGVALPFVALALFASPFLARPLNALLLGENEARSLGVHVERTKRRAVLASCLAVGVAVALTGTIGFIGLVAPHLVRLITGPDHRRVLPGAALLGACLVVSSDLAARTLIAPAELPIGIVTAALGAPFFLWLLRKRAAEVAV